MRSRFVVALPILVVASCSHNLDGPKPAPATVAPLAACDDQIATAIAITGSGFSPLNDLTLKNGQLELPQVTLTRGVDLAGMPVSSSDASNVIAVPNDPLHPELADEKWTSQMAMSFEICPPGTCSKAMPPTSDYGATPPPGLYDITVANKNGHTGTLARAVDIVPLPQLDAVVPDLLCDDKDNMVTLKGDWFYQVDGKPVTVTVGSQTYTPTLSDCRPLPAPMGLDLQACKTATISISAKTFMPGIQPVVVVGPDPVGCHSTKDVHLTFVPDPTLKDVVPDLVCDAQGDRTLTLDGTGFLTVDGKLPTINLGNGKMLTATSATNCTPVAGPMEMVQSCTQLTLTVPKATLPPDNYPVTVVNPPPADCESMPPVDLTITPPPSVTGVASNRVCNATGDTQFTLTGSGFLTVGTTGPKVAVSQNGATLGTFTGTTGGTCTPVMGPTEMAQSCTQVAVTVPKGTLVSGTYTFVVTNPDPAGCSSTEMATVTAYGPPTLTSISPKTVCAGGGTFVIHGTNLASGATVTVGSVSTSDVTAASDGTTATVVIGGGLAPGGPYDVTYANPDGCAATLPAQLSVSLGPIVFFVDPPTIWNGITNQITVYGANITPPIQSVAISIGNAAPLQLTFMTSSLHPNRATAIVPANTPAGAYDVTVTDQATCPATMPKGLNVVGQTSFMVSAVTPAFGYTGSSTAVQITSNGAFVKTPRAYLTPSGGGSNPATALSSVAYVDASTLTAVVPTGLAAGSYDIVVVNPDGTVGVKQGAFTVSANPVPTISTLQPATVNTMTGQSFQVAGQNFAANATVSLTCLDTSGAAVAAPMVMTGAPSSCTIAGQTQQCITVTGTFTAGVCIVTVSNPTDKTSVSFSSLAISNPSLKLGAFRAASNVSGMAVSFQTPRRAHALVAAQASAAARYLYAVGGDNGTEAGAYDSLEASTVDLEGNLGGFVALPNHLTKKHTFVGAVAIGRFVYVVGGDDGTGATATVERAAVLDPTHLPVVVDVDIVPGKGQGLGAGTWYYRVAPVMSGNDAFNPGGEGLPSDETIITLPAYTGNLQVTLTWNAFAGADHYRVYRSPSAGMTAGSEVLVADNVTTPTYTDKGAMPLQVGGNDVVPLPVGATGVFTAVAPLSTPRAAAAVTSVSDPANPSQHYLYALGGATGNEASPTPLKTTEFLSVLVNSDGSQTVGGSWSAGPSLNTAKWQTGGFSLLAGGNNYVWAGAGRTTGGGANGVTSSWDGAQVGAGGLPGAFTTLSSTSSRAGYAAIAVSNYLIAQGGAMGQPDNGGVQGTIYDAKGQLIAPEVANFSSTSVTMLAKRILTCAAIQSGFIYICGGQTDAQPASTSCDTTIW